MSSPNPKIPKQIFPLEEKMNPLPKFPLQTPAPAHPKNPAIPKPENVPTPRVQNGKMPPVKMPKIEPIKPLPMPNPELGRVIELLNQILAALKKNSSL